MSIKDLAKQLPLYGQQAVGKALAALGIAGHLRRVLCPVGDDGTVRWAYRTFWSRTAHDNEWWATYLASMEGQADSDHPASPEFTAPVPRPLKPAVQAPASQDPAVPQSAALEPAALEPASQEPAAQGPVVRKPVVQEPVVQEPVVQEFAGPASTGPECDVPASTGPERDVPASIAPGCVVPEPRSAEGASEAFAPVPEAAAPTFPAVSAALPASVEPTASAASVVPAAPVPADPAAPSLAAPVPTAAVPVQPAPDTPHTAHTPSAAPASLAVPVPSAVPAVPAVPRQPGPGDLPPVEEKSFTYYALAQLGCIDERLGLSDADCTALVPLAAEWLNRGVTVDYLVHALTSGLPSRIHSPIAFTRKRLETKIPPTLPSSPLKDPNAPGGPNAPTRHALVECTECAVPGPPEALPDGLCRSCRPRHSPTTGNDSTTTADPDVQAHAGRIRAALRDRVR
ncbi:hypothetical protein ACF1BP_27655 [Streptomyces sp. NPDC014735]|uniref:hypothetical protein n=1 Tax=unclassified Streptomyces TaxID=2593676 RepID=UPI0036F85620